MSEPHLSPGEIPHPPRQGRIVRRAAPWILLVGLASVAAGCGDDAGGESNDNQNNNNSLYCTYSIGASPYSPKVGDPVELVADWTGPCVPNPSGAYTWTITGPDQASVPFTTRQGGRLVDLVPTAAGSHFVELVVDDLSQGTVYQSLHLTVLDPTGMQETYLLRLTPPVDSTAPRQQRMLVVTGGTPISDRVVTLEDGVEVASTLQGPNGPFAGYLRFVESGFALYRELHVPTSGQFRMAVLPGALYDVTVVPDGAEPAPIRLASLTVSALLASGTFQFDAGVPVVGYVEDHLGAGVGQAQAALRSGGLASSVGTSDSLDGRFVVWSRPGPQGLEVVPREGALLPRVQIPASAAIPLGSGGGLSLRLRYHAVDAAPVSVTVVAGAPGQAVPVPGARVTLEATSLGTVGTVTVTQDGSELASLDAPGSFRVQGLTDASGALPLLTLPLGTYRAVIEVPGGAPSGYGTTVTESLVVAAGTSDLALPLAGPATLAGQILDELLAPVPGVRVVAVTKVGVGSAAETTTDAEGAFSLPVIRGADYTLLLYPPPEEELSRRIFGPVSVGQGDVTAVNGPGPGGAIVLSPGLQVDGLVVHGANGLSGVLVQAIPSAEPTEPVLAEAVTGPGGEFSMVVPDPGTLE